MSRSAPGFRFSKTDAVAISVAIAFTALLWPAISQLALLFPIVLAHFFLFCNVFRIHRTSELVWAGAFVTNVAAWTLAGHFSWPAILLTQTPLTLFLIALAIRSPRYHGIGYAILNRIPAPSLQ